MAKRWVFFVMPVLAGAMAMATALPASASPVSATPVSALRSGPAARIIDNVLDGLSCTTQPDNPDVHSACLAVGSFADGQFVNGLQESSFNGKWGSNIFGSARRFTEPLQVSCVPQPADIPACVAVGQAFTSPDDPVQLVATGNANGFSPLSTRNPKGTTFSVLDDVSCVSISFCLLVGDAGTSRPTARGRVFLPHSTVYRWNGRGLTAMTVPAPAHARVSELAGVSCPTATSCMAVGGYARTSGGTLLPYSALWAGGGWHIKTAPLIGGAKVTLFEAVSCAAAANCVAVGYSQKARTSAFAMRYAAGGWHRQQVAPAAKSMFFSVSCPQVTMCVAVGRHGSRSLAQAWNGSRWTVQTVPVTPAPLSTDTLFHVSCVSTTACTAVGYRHDPASKFSFRTLALGWNGAKWSIEKTINQ